MTPEEITKLKQRSGYKTLPSEKKAEIDAMLASGDDKQVQQASSNIKDRELSLTSGIITGSAELMDMGALLIEPEREDGTINVGKATSQAGLKMAGQGATMGASVGTSIMPGIGTGIGAAAGTIIGGAAGMVTGNKKAKHINKRISSKNNRSAASRRAMENIAESAEFASETPQYLATGGFVEGKGGPTSDSNPASLEPGSFVIPSISGNENSEIGSIVKTIAKTIGEKKPLKRSGGGRKVNLSDGELVIPEGKVIAAESVAQENGTSLVEIKNVINAMRPKTARPSKGMYKGGYFDPKTGKYFNGEESKKKVDESDLEVESLLDFYKKEKEKKKKANRFKDETSFETLSKNTDSKKQDSKKSTVKKDFLDDRNDYSFDRILGATQSVAGMVGTMKEEAKVRKNLSRQEAEVNNAANEEGAAAFAASAKKKAAIERGFSDTNNSIERMKRKAIKDLAQNSLTTQEFSNNYAQTAAAIADKIGDVNNAKTTALLQNESDLTSSIKDTIQRRSAARLGVLDLKNDLSAAKMTQSALLQKAGIDNLVASIRAEKNETIRKRKMKELIQIANEQGVSLDQLSVFKNTDWMGVNSTNQ